MISFNYETDFKLSDELIISNWISNVITAEGKKEGEVAYIFCTDAYLHKLNLEYLKHDTLTDIISFDYSIGKVLSGDIFISIDRVEDNAKDYNVSAEEELRRVMVHGILHFCGYSDKSDSQTLFMRTKENHYIELFENS